MACPDQVARCIESMTKVSDLPVTIKHRIGIDNHDDNEFLKEFVFQVSEAGAKRFAIHARKAWLKGLNPKQNRTIPPLEYEKVEKLKKTFPKMIIELNGGLKTPEDCINALKTFDGAMVGRAAYSHPMLWRNVDEIIFGETAKNLKRSAIIKQMIPYTENHLQNDGKLWDICKHTLHLVQGVKGARKWRNDLSRQAQKQNADLIVLENAAQQLEDAGL